MGIFTTKDGTNYNGQFVNNMIQGYGNAIKSDGSEYRGEWEENKQSGYGIELWKDNSKYEGKFSYIFIK